MGGIAFRREVQVDAQRFQSWTRNIALTHQGGRFVANERVGWTPLRRPLADCRVALVTTGGAHLHTEAPFDLASPHGDWSYRVIPAGTALRDVRFSHAHYDHSDADADGNCMLPLDRLRELVAAGELGREAPRHFGFMGFIPDPDGLLRETAPEVARSLAADGTDVALLTPS